MNQIDKYISILRGKKQYWTSELVGFTRDGYPELTETFENQMPTYRGEDFYIAFAARENYFTLYTDDVRALSLLKELLPTATLGEGYARIKYSEQAAVDVMTDIIKEVVSYHSSRRSTKVTDIKAVRKWNKITPDTQKLIIDNAFCSKCGVTTIEDFVLHDDRFGVVLKGKCKNCGNNIARYVEDQ